MFFLGTQCRIIRLHCRPIVYDYIRFFCGGLRKHIDFERCSSRSSKVIDFGTNQKLVYVTSYQSVIVTLVLSSLVSEILQCRFCAHKPTPPLFHRNFKVFPLHQIADAGAGHSRNLMLISRKLFSKYPNVMR